MENRLGPLRINVLPRDSVEHSKLFQLHKEWRKPVHRLGRADSRTWTKPLVLIVLFFHPETGPPTLYKTKIPMAMPCMLKKITIVFWLSLVFSVINCILPLFKEHEQFLNMVPITLFPSRISA